MWLRILSLSLAVQRSKDLCSFRKGHAEQIVGRERRERVSQLTWRGGGRLDSRRRVNSTVMVRHEVA